MISQSGGEKINTNLWAAADPSKARLSGKSWDFVGLSVGPVDTMLATILMAQRRLQSVTNLAITAPDLVERVTGLLGCRAACPAFRSYHRYYLSACVYPLWSYLLLLTVHVVVVCSSAAPEIARILRSKVNCKRRVFLQQCHRDLVLLATKMSTIIRPSVCDDSFLSRKLS